ncbi:Membrane protein involved in the export of O-antigen and teichoic acid [Halobacillus alkaliphilus]|uniref:Membrane protein involved in the export of O-antigen and teichoic acid n=1 Tax=Halobacillus alkaliphilus TaxID=396056 RepID=A0A1I2SYM7_9BACI|nr:polysaccharide biosynthesis protein [Halobacillus alkaliphilus]SFG55286.1 Membrane protein involved in the export of O-antigen and teichoic acid [Halobacillus alkaliphilus]
MSKILKGTMLLTAGTFLSKFLGMIYTVPFENMVGTEGTDLFSYAYVPYSILLSLSSMGIPVAVSKFVSKYNALEDYETGRRMLKAGQTLMAISGVLAFLILFFSAEQVASWTVGADSPILGDATMVIQMVSFALIVIPPMSITRGFFQGYESMAPTAVSQVVEQIVRIVFLLVSVFIIVQVLQGPIPMAVGFATFAAFIGGIASCIVLYIYWRKRKPYLDRQLDAQEYTYGLSNKEMFQELFTYAGPFILVGIATPLYQLIDQFTLERAITAAGLEYKNSFSIINFLSHKLVMIPVTFGIGLSLALLPAITQSFTNKNMRQLNNQVNQALQIIAILIIPAAVGLSVVALEAYGTFYGVDENLEDFLFKGSLLRWYAPVGLFLALYTVTSSVLQGINRQNFAVISLGTGIFLKLVLNTWFITIMGPKGAILATGIGVAAAVTLNFWRIFTAIEFSYRQLYKRTLLVLILTTIMAISVFLVKGLAGLFLNPTESRLDALLVLIVSIGSGGIIYLWLTYKSTLLERVLGGRVRVLDKFLKRR